MDIFVFDLQWFADAGTLVNATQNYVNSYTGETESFVTGVTDLAPLNKTFWDTALLDNARDELIYTQLGKKVSLPENKGRTIEFRRWKRLADIVVLTEGVIPTGKKMSIVAITVSLVQYGDYVAISDLLDAHGIEDTKLGAVEELGAAAGLTLEKTVRNTLMGSTNIIFGDATNKSTGAYVSTPTTEAELQTALVSYNVNMTPRVIKRAATQLQKGAQGVKYSGGYYVAVVHPDVAEDLRNDNAWIESHKYAAVEEIFNGEIGRMHGVRFLVSNLAPVIKTQLQTYATYKTFFFAKEAFAVIDPDGGSLETIIKDKDQIGGPLNQFLTVGCKAETASKILYQERLVTVWTGSSYSATETAN